MSVDLAELGPGGTTWTRPFVYSSGQYSFGDETVPYYSATLTIAEALRQLHLAYELPVDPDDPVHLDELIQRTLNDDRAGGEIAEYLKRPSRIKFFNSFTVVLIPTSAAGAPIDTYGEPAAWPAGVPEDARYDVQRAGGVHIRELKNGGGIGYLMWQPDTVKPVIIDGQHRFLALRSLQSTQPQLLNSESSRIPILFLAPSPEFGFAPPSGAPQSIVSSSRAIFTDINKNAKRVSVERQYLLDDASLHAVAMRRLLTGGIGGTYADEADAIPARIPLAAVDWVRADRTRFDDMEKPAITTVRSLYQLVLQTLRSVPGDQDWDAWETWIAEMDTNLAPAAPWNTVAMLARVENARDQERQFVLRAVETQAASTSYASGRGQAVALPLTRLAPYAAMIQQLRAAKLLGARGELWLGQDERGRTNYLSRFEDGNLPAVAATVARTVKTQYPLAYQVVFQRAFLIAAREVFDLHLDLASRWGLHDATQTSVLLHWIERFNERVAPRLSDFDFWRGTSVAPDRHLEYVRTPMHGVAGLTLLLTVEDWGFDAAETVSSTQFEQLLSRTFQWEPASDEEGDESDEVLEESAAEIAYRLVLDDPFEPGVTAIGLRAAERWSTLLEIRRGRAPDPVTGLTRVATRWYRDSLRRYATSLHQASIGVDPSADVLERMVLTLGARRLAGATGSA